MASDVMYSIAVKKGIKKWGVDWSKSLAYLCHPEFMGELAKGYRYYINKFVPKKSGTLRSSAHPVGKAPPDGGNGTGSATVYWGDRGKAQKYAHYQFVGDVYGPNKPVFKGSTHTGWRSPKEPGGKFNTHRKLGEGTPYSYTLHDGKVVTVKGYTTPGTKYNWIKEFKEDKGDGGETAINIRAGRYMYEAFCVKSGIRPVGGKHVYNSWNQIKNRLT